jgi:hypothetical protein
MGNGRTIAIYLIDCAVPPLWDSQETCVRNVAWSLRFPLFSGYYASKCPSFPLREGPHWHATSSGCFIVTLTRQLSMTNNVTSVNFLWYHDRAKKEEKYKLYILCQTGRTGHGACYFPRLGLGTRRPRFTLLEDSSTTSHSVRGLINHTPCCARGLFRPLSDHNLTPAFLGYMWNLTHIQLGDHHFLDLATRLMLSPSSKLRDYIGTMHLSVHLRITFPWSFILDPGTMCLRHLLLGSGTKWAHFT